LPDPRFEALQAGGKRSGIGISLECVACDPREFEGAGEVAEVEADVGAAQREIGVDPRGPAEVSADPPDVLKLARGLGMVTALPVRECCCRVGDRAVGRLVQVCFGDQPGRFDRPSLHVSPIAHLCGREGQIAEADDPRVGELGLVA